MDNAWPTPVLFHQAPRLVQRSDFDSKESFEGLCLLHVALLLHQPQDRVRMEPLDDQYFPCSSVRKALRPADVLQPSKKTQSQRWYLTV
jgi:hypothetical protein